MSGVDLQALFKEAARERVGVLLRSAGYRGSAPTWRKTSPRGDVCLVNLQRSAWNDAHSLTFYANLAAVPRPCWELDEDRPRLPSEFHGAIRGRLLHALPRPQEWSFHDDESCRATFDRLEASLVDVGIGVLDRLLDRDQVLALAQDAVARDSLMIEVGDGLSAHFGRAPLVVAAALLAERGPSVSLDRALDALDVLAAGGWQPPRPSAWFRARAADGLPGAADR